MEPTKFSDFNELDVDRIVTATRLDVPDLNRDALLRDLIGCYKRYKKVISSSTFQRHRVRHTSIRKHIDRLVKLITEDDADLGVIHKISEGTSDVFVPQLRTLAARIAQSPDGEPGNFARQNKARYSVRGSALQELTGLWLRDVYERHFKKEAGSSRPKEGRPPEGPYIRFVTTVLADWKIDCSPETVDDALSRKKSKNSPSG